MYQVVLTTLFWFFQVNWGFQGEVSISSISEQNFPNVEEEQSRLVASEPPTRSSGANETEVDQEEENFKIFISTQEIPEGTKEITIVDESLNLLLMVR
ncbi:hypothetical protein DLAC_11832 [Tieghemostelium lacteum]|uniref:Uncharacterized protein n=1 Tax=Tieghemostelium lacteum TaxID=361077 RepID=A0A151Z335_TIELA|nr:hypothetical protein DLAC_11832 [Tieghemostelium lacteum]|eukprot:KYQ88224.1 hypothetical protein DLAC_11832 [Tieghemostelium lacteum]